MLQNPFVSRAVIAGASCGVAALLLATPSVAKESKKAICTAAYVNYKKAVEEQKAGHIHEARELVQTCIESTCGGLIPKCRAFEDKLKGQLPTVILAVTDDIGGHGDIQVKMDGSTLTSKLDGLPITVEPGTHEFTFSTDSGAFSTQKILIVEGQRDRFITASMRAGSPAPAPSPAPDPPKPAAEAKPPAKEEASSEPQGEKSQEDRPQETPAHEGSRGGTWAMPTSPLPYILGGVGVLGLAGGGLLTVWGNKDNSTLESSCSPYCKSSAQDHVKTMYVLADVSYGVGAAALAVTAFLFATSRSVEGGDKPAPHQAMAVGVQPIRSGAFAAISGAF